MTKVVEVKIVFASGHVEFFDIDIDMDDQPSYEDFEKGIIDLVKAHAGHNTDGKKIDAAWAVMSKFPMHAYCVNSNNVDFVSMRVK
jgi:hypothetical protein